MSTNTRPVSTNPTRLFVGVSRGNTPWAHAIHLVTVAAGYPAPWTFRDGPATHVFVAFAWEGGPTAVFEAVPPCARWTVGPLPADSDVGLWELRDADVVTAYAAAAALCGRPYDFGAALLTAVGRPGTRGFAGAEICTEVLERVVRRAGGPWGTWADAFRRGPLLPERAAHLLAAATKAGQAVICA